MVINDKITNIFTTLYLPRSGGTLIVAGRSLGRYSSCLTRNNIYILGGVSSFRYCFRSAVGTNRCRGSPRDIEIVVRSSPSIVKALIGLNISFSAGGNNSFGCAERKTRERGEVLRRGSRANGRVATALLTVTGAGGGVAFIAGAAVVSVVREGGAYCNVIIRSTGNREDTVFTESIVLTANNVNNLFGGSAGFPRVANSTFTVTLGRGVRLGGVGCVRVRPAALCDGGDKQHFLVDRDMENRNTVLLGRGNREFASRLRPQSIIAGTVYGRVRGFNASRICLALPAVADRRTTREFPGVFRRYVRRNCSVAGSGIPIAPNRRCVVNKVGASVGNYASVHRLCTTNRATYGKIRNEGELTSGDLLRDLIFSGQTTSLVTNSSSRGPRCRPRVSFTTVPPGTRHRGRFGGVVVTRVGQGSPRFCSG